MLIASYFVDNMHYKCAIYQQYKCMLLALMAISIGNSLTIYCTIMRSTNDVFKYRKNEKGTNHTNAAFIK